MAASLLTKVANAVEIKLLYHSGSYQALSTSFMKFFTTDEQLSKHSYWKKRYQQQSQNLSFDWFLDSTTPLLDIVISNIDRIYEESQGAEKSAGDMKHTLSFLELGCGTSDLAHGILTHTSTPVSLYLLDFVHEALDYQRHQLDRCSFSNTESSFHTVCADVLQLPFHHNSFQMALDKGTMDALLKDRSQGQVKTQHMISEILRVLKPGGRFLQVSDEDPDSRLLLLEEICHRYHNSVRPCDAAPSQTSEIVSKLHQQNIPEVDQHATYVTSQGDFRNPLNLCNHKTHSENAKENCDNIVKWKDKLNSTEVSKHQYEENVSDLQKLRTSNDSMNNDKISDGITRIYPVKTQFSDWSFKVVPTSWGNEYFIYWINKLKC